MVEVIVAAVVAIVIGFFDRLFSYAENAAAAKC